MFRVLGTPVPAQKPAADPPPANDKVNPAAPNTGTVAVRCFRFEACLVRGIVNFLHAFCKNLRAPSVPSAKVLCKADARAFTARCVLSPSCQSIHKPNRNHSQYVEPLVWAKAQSIALMVYRFNGLLL